jgi:polygalacturonase
VGRPSEDILVMGCHMHDSKGNGVVIGSETAGSIRNVVITDCVMHKCLSGFRIRSPRGRGGVVERIRISNIVMDECEEMAIKISNFFDSIRIEGYYSKFRPERHNIETSRSRKEPINEGTPTFQDILFSGLVLGKVREVAIIEGLPERYIRGLVLENMTVTGATGGISCAMVADLTVSNVEVNTLESPAVDAREAERVEVHRLRCARPTTESPLVWLENVSSAFVHGCYVASPGGTYKWLQTERCKTVTVSGNEAPGQA